jgi:hypothetical protein
MVRAAIVGLLMPSSGDPKKDREIFLKLLTMDEEGLWRRKKSAIPLRAIYECLKHEERSRWFEADADPEYPRYQKGVRSEVREGIQRLVFERMTYDERLSYCDRPEQINGPSQAAWEEINAHLGTRAESLSGLVQELGIRHFGIFRG